MAGVSDTRYAAAGTPAEWTGDLVVTTSNDTTAERLGGLKQRPTDAELLDVRTVAALLNCSARHVYRLSDAGRMPRPVKLGQLVRWRRTDLTNWISGGCKPVTAAREVRR